MPKHNDTSLTTNTEKKYGDIKNNDSTSLAEKNYSIAIKFCSLIQVDAYIVIASFD